MTKKPPVLGFLRFQIGVLSPSRVQVGLKSVRVASVNWWNPVPSTLMMKIALFHLTVTGSSPCTAEAHELIAGLGPGRLEVHVAGRQRLPSAFAGH